MAGPYRHIDEVPEFKPGDQGSASFLNLARRFMKRRIVVQGPGVRQRTGPMGDFISISQGAGGVDIQPFAIYEEREDLYKCRAWNWSTQTIKSNNEVLVAKDYLLQTTPFHELSITNADGESVHYEYTSVNERTLTFDGDASDTEDQVIIAKANPQKPGYHGDIIWAVRVPSTGVVYGAQTVFWQDCNFSGRHWAEVAE